MTKVSFFATLSVMCFFLQTQTSQPNKIVLLIDQVPSERPIANTVETFWGDKEYFDTIQITGQALVQEINRTVESLSPTQLSNYISIDIALVRYNKGQALDTLYGWHWFYFWEKDNRTFKDASKRLSDLFLKTYHSQWKK